MVGEVIKIAENSKKLMSEATLRIKIKIDIHKPLTRGVFIKLNLKQDPQWFYIQYEQLPNFCYICGRLGHVIDDCEDKKGNTRE